MFMCVLCCCRDTVEGELVFLGFIVMQNRVKPESKPTIETLNKADIRSVMVTGMTHQSFLSLSLGPRMCESLWPPCCSIILPLTLVCVSSLALLCFGPRVFV